MERKAKKIISHTAKKLHFNFNIGDELVVCVFFPWTLTLTLTLTLTHTYTLTFTHTLTQ